jgi:hypothetical protein
VEDKSVHGIWDTIKKCEAKVVKTIHNKEFEKLLPMADPTNGNDFLIEVCLAIEFFSTLYLILHLFLFRSQSSPNICHTL